MELKKENQSEELDSSSTQQETQETSPNGLSVTSEAKLVPPQPSASSSALSFSSLLPKALSAVLHPTLPPGLSSDQHTSPPNLEQLQTELRDLRDQFSQMKSQHNKEIKLLMNELDEEKRIRLTLQMEIQRIKKHMSK